MALIRELVRFFKTGIPPVNAEDTIEIFAFTDAAEDSRRQGGKPVSVTQILQKAEEEAARPTEPAK